MVLKRLENYKQTILYGLILAILLLILRWLEFKFIIMQHAFEIYATAIAILFTGLGIWLAIKLSRPKIETKIIEKEIYLPQESAFVLNQKAIQTLGLSSRELEVLQLMAQGLSNLEIADRLFLSLNTIKTHSTRLFEKMEVKRRTQAIELGKKLSIIP